MSTLNTLITSSDTRSRRWLPNRKSLSNRIWKLLVDGSSYDPLGCASTVLLPCRSPRTVIARPNGRPVSYHSRSPTWIPNCASKVKFALIECVLSEAKRPQAFVKSHEPQRRRSRKPHTQSLHREDTLWSMTSSVTRGGRRASMASTNINAVVHRLMPDRITEIKEILISGVMVLSGPTSSGMQLIEVANLRDAQLAQLTLNNPFKNDDVRRRLVIVMAGLDRFKSLRLDSDWEPFVPADRLVLLVPHADVVHLRSAPEIWDRIEVLREIQAAQQPISSARIEPAAPAVASVARDEPIDELQVKSLDDFVWPDVCLSCAGVAAVRAVSRRGHPGRCGESGAEANARTANVRRRHPRALIVAEDRFGSRRRVEGLLAPRDHYDHCVGLALVTHDRSLEHCRDCRADAHCDDDSHGWAPHTHRAPARNEAVLGPRAPSNLPASTRV